MTSQTMHYEAERVRFAIPRLATAFRYLVGAVYLLGAPTHVYFGIWRPDAYADMPAPWNPIAEWAWLDLFVPNAGLLALALAGFELMVAVLLFSEGRRARLGLFLALLFHVALLAIFGMWPYTAPMIVALGATLAVAQSSPTPSAGHEGN